VTQAPLTFDHATGRLDAASAFLRAIANVDYGFIDGGQGESVEMMALDSLFDQNLVRPQQRLVIKLDVEGMEIEAIKGSKRLLGSEVVFIAEEHGVDRSHAVSRFILSDTPCRLFVLDPQSSRYEPLIDLAMLDRIKTNSATGYNVFATNSPFWEERIKSVPVTRH